MKNWTLYILLLVILLAVFVRGIENEEKVEEQYWQFFRRFEQGEIYEMVISEKAIKYRVAGQSNKEYRTYVMYDEGDLETFRNKEIDIRDPAIPPGEPAPNLKRIRIKVRPPSEVPWWISIVGSWFPFLILIFLWFYFLQKIQGGGTKAMSFGKSRARFLDTSKSQTTFDDVAGCQEAKEDLQEIVTFLKHPKRFQQIGARIPRGVLMVGPPGTGKTLLARAVAGEAKVPFLHISGSDFVEMFVGVGASRVRDLFEQGKKHAPCLMFIDEIDAVGRQRGAGLGGGHDEREQTLNQLLVEMDGFEPNEGLILIAATNRPDVLDPALLRPGRFDRQIHVDLPDVTGRARIFDVHLAKVHREDKVDPEMLARATPGFSGADIANLVNEAALLAARLRKTQVQMEDLEEARDKVLMGPERRSKVITPEVREKTAWHEAGHALISRLIGQADAVHKVSVIPRGRALGVTSFLPDEQRRTQANMADLRKDLSVAMGGRVAEELRFEEISAGAADDIRRATALARRMVCEFGMSERLGPIALSSDNHLVFLGRDISKDKPYSEATAAIIDAEVSRIVHEAYEETRRRIRENMDVLERIAEQLVAREVLSGEELDAIIRGEELPPLAERVEETRGREADAEEEPEAEEETLESPNFPGKLAPEGVLGGD